MLANEQGCEEAYLWLVICALLAPALSCPSYSLTVSPANYKNGCINYMCINCIILTQEMQWVP